LIQRQFEDPDDNWCYIETHDEKKLWSFSIAPRRFRATEVVNRDRSSEGQSISVTFAMVATEFAEASQVVKIISGEIEPS
jgi:hypothetical protein